MNNYVTETPSNIRNGLGYKDRPPHEKSEECKRFERELDAELVEIDDSLAKQRDELITERDWLITGWSDALDGWTKAEKRNCELTAERDEMKAFANRLECAAHDKLGVMLFGVDYVTEDFMLHVRDTLTAERDELREKLGDTTEAISELMKKQPRTFDPHDVPGSLRLVGRYIDELELRLVGKPECEICDRATLLVEIEKLRDERDGWKANAKSILNAESYKFASELDAESYIDCGKVENDSREKLEEDVRKRYTHTVSTAMWPPSANKHTDMVSASIDTVLGWLDRQAAITRRETRQNWQDAPNVLDRTNLQTIAELTAERDALARDLAECDENRIEFRDQRDHAEEMLAQMERERDYWKLHPERWADKCRDVESERDAYHERVCELEIELAQANGNLKNTTHNHAAAKAKYERAQADAARAREKQLEAERRYAELLEKPPEGAWAERIAGLEAGNRELRERLSEAIGHAHEIGKLGDLEVTWGS